MAKIIIKADDFRATSNDRWLRFALCCVEHNLPAAVGFIAGDVGGGAPADEELLCLMKQPRFDIWNHSYVHERDQYGNTDFCGPTMEEQLANIVKTQSVASELLGTAPKGFGPPYNKFDCNTLKALEKVDCFEYAFDIGYLSGLRSIPKALFAECEGPKNGRKFGLEAAINNSKKFMLRRVDFVLQIHPGNHWEEDCIRQFSHYVRYAKASGYEFGSVFDMC